ncbi:MAG: glycosyltransferase family 1 protein [Nakamurella sp.]
MEQTEPIRVASIPAAHPYVQHLAAPDGASVVTRLPDPPPDVSDPLPGQWWPPEMLRPDWVAAHDQEFDLVHLHFGFDAVEPAELHRWLGQLRRSGRPLVFTVHDLVNPHFTDQRLHRAQLDVLIPAAAELITLTPGAAAVINEEWGRTAEVVPHPHMFPLPNLGDRARKVGETLLIGVHAKSLRANLDPLPVLIALDSAMKDVQGTRVRVDLHPDLLTRTDQPATALRQWLQGKTDDTRWQVSVHERFTDDQLLDYLAGLDLCVLAYGFGTHSGWLEACVDVGTGVLVPSTGFYAEQHGHPSFPRSATGDIDQSGFTQALRQITKDPRRATPPRPDRLAQRRQIAADHEQIYRRALLARQAR